MSVFPCADMLTGLNIAGEVHTEQSTESSQDGCSLFCICNCCGTVVPITLAISSSENPYTHPTFFVSYSEQPISEFSYTVWQPPKQA